MSTLQNLTSLPQMDRSIAFWCWIVSLSPYVTICHTSFKLRCYLWRFFVPFYTHQSDSIICYSVPKDLYCVYKLVETLSVEVNSQLPHTSCGPAHVWINVHLSHHSRRWQIWTARLIGISSLNRSATLPIYLPLPSLLPPWADSLSVVWY